MSSFFREVASSDALWRPVYLRKFKDAVVPKKREAGRWFFDFAFKFEQKRDVEEMCRHKHREVCCVVVGCRERGKKSEVQRHCLKEHGRTLDKLVLYAKDRKLWLAAT